MQGRATLQCFGKIVAELAVNVSCIAVDECERVCSYLCSDPQRFNGTCAVLAPEGTRFYEFDPEALRLGRGRRLWRKMLVNAARF